MGQFFAYAAMFTVKENDYVA
ncbi:membrane protein YoeI [Cronobacter sakazakii]|nr:membrane protein YoeI [Cronobacter sakazakii]ELY2651873.1 membrane protein YoeI [Cronobacter sakazakii]ELY2685158.1 membrane protein YoeI [Cronobacter sakazakii]ELY2730679.1 membrane protein YoeI [Cronobacter sakazakii]EME1902703.1 membrane protein YoeI [Cronobacter sakazakii]EME1959820.1 membrane protein YoeI [Cronobacter sakazakii]